MRFNPKARLDTKRVSDRGRGRSGGGAGGGAMRLPIPSGAAAGGGLGGIIIVILFLVLTQCVGSGTGGDALPDTGLDTGRIDAAESERYANCKTGEDANTDVDCARVAVENSLYDFWSETLPSQSDTEFRAQRDLTTFSGAVDTGCGNATSAVGPFYCPVDQTIYLDTTFFDDVLERQLDGPSGDFVEPYVLAHEYGHHIQNLTGALGQVRTQQGPTSDAVRLELQADCYAGMWTGSATRTDDVTGQPLFLELSEQDISQAIEAAKAVGDDRIQQQSTGRVDPEGWTHGSAEQRMRWFMVGYEQGSIDACDTFAAAQL
jgi:predicted metalloprotease